MKTIVVVLFFVLISFMAKADDSKYEITYPRDNSFCQLDGRKIEIKLKGFDKFIQPADATYGEEVYVIQSNNKVISVKDENTGRYRFLKGESNHCSKDLAIRLNQSELALFLEKDNRPLGNTISVLYYNFNNSAYEIIDTKISVSSAYVYDNKLHLLTIADPCKKQNGTVKIENKNFIYTSSDSARWLVFDGKNFKTDRQRTFKNHEGSKYFNNEDEFFRAFDQGQTYTIAVNHGLNKRCIRFGEVDSWKCTSWRK